MSADVFSHLSHSWIAVNCGWMDLRTTVHFPSQVKGVAHFLTCSLLFILGQSSSIFLSGCPHLSPHQSKSTHTCISPSLFPTMNYMLGSFLVSVCSLSGHYILLSSSVVSWSPWTLIVLFSFMCCLIAPCLLSLFLHCAQWSLAAEKKIELFFPITSVSKKEGFHYTCLFSFTSVIGKFKSYLMIIYLLTLAL